MIAGERNWLRRMALELHRARRFYERPEAQREYQERPTPGAASPPVERPEPEFHERCAMAGDHPSLLRRLGLVIDLKVADPGAPAQVAMPVGATLAGRRVRSSARAG